MPGQMTVPTIWVGPVRSHCMPMTISLLDWASEGPPAQRAAPATSTSATKMTERCLMSVLLSSGISDMDPAPPGLTALNERATSHPVLPSFPRGRAKPVPDPRSCHLHHVALLGEDLGLNQCQVEVRGTVVAHRSREASI